MIFRLMFKTPDVLDSTIAQHLKTHCPFHEEYDHDCEACFVLKGESLEELATIATKFIRHGECITVEFDTVAGTAMVVPVR